MVTQMSIGFLKFFVSSCSNFDFRFWFDDKNRNCEDWIWISQAGAFIISFICLFFGFCCMKEQNIILLEWNRLYFPLLLGIILLFLQFLFTYTINTHYIIQVVIDFCAYAVSFVEALYFVQFRKYKEYNKKSFASLLISPNNTFPRNDCKCCSIPNCKLLMMFAIFFGYVVIFLITIIGNFIMDVKDVGNAAGLMSEDYGKDKAVVESIAFLEIIFENTLLIEYIHVIIGPID